MRLELVLYLLYVVGAYGGGAGGYVSISRFADWFRCSKYNAQKLVDEHVGVHIERNDYAINKGHGFEYGYTLTDAGLQYVRDNYRHCHSVYTNWHYDVMHDLLEQARKVSLIGGRQIKRSENQMSMFEDDKS